MIYESNLEQLRKCNSQLYNIINEDDFTYNENVVRIEAAKNGTPIVVYTKDGKDTFLNSKYNPESEAEKYMVDFFDLPQKAVLVMFGFANGSFLRAFLEKAKNDDIYCVIYEPCPEVFMSVLHHIDITDLLADERISWVVDGLNDDIFRLCMRMLLDNYNIKTSRHMTLPKYSDLFPDKQKHMIDMSVDVMNRIKMNANLLRIHGDKICKNSIMNIIKLYGARTSEDFIGKFPKALTAIVVAAGPSLEKNIEQLKAAKGKSLIIVVDAAIPVVLKHGIEPDMIICVDMIKPLKYFMDESLKKIPFLVWPQTNYEVLDYMDWENLIFVATNSVLWAKLFHEAGSEIYEMDLGGSVATAAIITLINWDIKRIILVGQDLALTDSRLHAGDKETYKDELGESNYKYVEGINGDKVLTRLDYYEFLERIEEIGFRYKDLQLIDATEGGAKKKNTTIMPLKDAISHYCTEFFDIDNVMERVPRLYMGEKESLIHDALVRFDSNIKQLGNRASLSINACRRALDMLNTKNVNIDALKEINDFIWEFDQQLYGLDEYSFIEQLIQNEEDRLAEDVYIEASDSLSEAVRMYKKCEEYYLSVADVIPELEGYIAECMEHVKND